MDLQRMRPMGMKQDDESGAKENSHAFRSEDHRYHRTLAKRCTTVLYRMSTDANEGCATVRARAYVAGNRLSSEQEEEDDEDEEEEEEAEADEGRAEDDEDVRARDRKSAAALGRTVANTSMKYSI
jgi:hypothetical protein